MIKRAKIAKCEQIAESLKEELSGIEVHHGMPVVSAKDLARQYKVSVPTAHNALNILVKEGLLYRKQGSGTFFNCLNQKKKCLIGIADQTIYPEFLSQELINILSYHIIYASDYLKSEGCDIRMITYKDLMEHDVLQGLDGLLISCMYLDSKSIKRILKSKIPVVGYRYNHPNNFPISHSCYDLNTGIAEALNELELTTESRINLIYEQIPYGEHARKCWLKHLKKRNIQDSQIQITAIETSELEISCYRLIRVYPEQFKHSVILVSDDEIAKNLINAMTLEGFEAGKDYRLIGIGNRADHGMESAKNLHIASIDLPIKLMAEESAKLLLYKISNPSDCHCSVMIPTHFIKRKSSGSTEE